MDLFRSREEKNWFDKCKKILLDPANENPFPKPPIATNFYNNPPSFCYGRDKYINNITSIIKESINYKQPKLIRVIGKQGIGKSTLICWATKGISDIYPIPIIYLETSGQPEDFEMKSIYRQIISKFEKTGYSNNLLLNSVRKFINTYVEMGGNLYKELTKKFSGEDIDKLARDVNFVEKKVRDVNFYNKIQTLLKDNLILLQRFVEIDLNFLLIYWKSHIQNPEAIESLKAFKGNYSYSGFSVETDNDASKYIDELIELVRWSFDGRATITLIFDHLEAGISEHQEKVYKNLFSLLLNLRQKKFLTIILSGTLDAFDALDQVLQEDQKLQLDNWSKIISLSNLDPENVIQIVNKYLLDFWNQFNYEPPPDKSLFPFGKNSIKYLYEDNSLDLRKTLRNLYELIEKYRNSGELEHVDTFFKAFKAFRKRDDVILTFIEQKEFAKKILNSSIQDKNRSTKVEMAIVDFFTILKNHPDYSYLTDVKHEPPLGESGRKPDIFLEFFGNKGANYVRNLGIEVKIYRKSNKISKHDIEKTYQLLEEKALDYVTWISNVELDLKYRYALDDEIKIHLGRVSPLDDLELGYLSLMVFFKEVYERSPEIDEAETILNKIKLSPVNLKMKIENLPKLTETKEEIKPIDLTDFPFQTEKEKKEKKVEDKDITEKIPDEKREPIEIGREQIKEVVRNYIEEKSKTNKQITYHYTTKAVREELSLKEEKEIDDDIWTIALDIGDDYCERKTTKTIYFEG